jgi:nitrite reductase/ring-hydroxylating ferredoxin subunit
MGAQLGAKRLMRRLFNSLDLPARGSQRFDLRAGGEGFVLRADDGSVHAYVNECAHRAQPVDLGDGKLWRRDGSIECQAHGALFEARTGRCVGGPCLGGSLKALPVEERDGAVWLLAEPELSTFDF